MNIIEIEKLTNFNHLNLFSIKYQDKTGKLKSWIFASRLQIPEVMLKQKNILDIKTLDIKSSDTPEVKKNLDMNSSDTPEVKSKSVKKPNAVVLVPFHVEHQKLVIIKEFRLPLGDYQYGFPAGLVDKGEEIDKTATRELKEETGLDTLTILKISPVIYSSSGMTDESIALVYVTCTGEPSIKWNEDSEDITVLMVSSQEARELLEIPTIKFDVKSWMVISTFATTGKIIF